MQTTYFGAFLGILMVGAAFTACDDGPVIPPSTTAGGSAGTSMTGGGGTGGSAAGMGGAGAGGATGGAAGATGGSSTGGTFTGSGGSGGSMATVYGYCSKPCGTVSDCCPMGAMDCPSNMYPNNYHCDKGACRPAECMSTADCAALDPKQDCYKLTGLSTCVNPCTTDGDCMAPTTCSGTDDNGKKYCTSAGGGCTDDASCNGFGKCVDKLCVCTADADCTFQGFTKCAL